MDNGGQRRGESDFEKISVRSEAHKIGHRHTHAQRTDNSLYHNEFCAAYSVIEAGVAEETDAP